MRTGAVRGGQVTTFLSLWLAMWPQRRKASRHVPVLAVATVVVLVAAALWFAVNLK